MIFLILLWFSACAFGGGLPLRTSAEGAILINANTGAILYEKNAHKPLYPASITKIATALYAIEREGNNLDRMITASQTSIGSVSMAERVKSNYTLPPYWIERGGSHMGIKKGEKLPLEDLLYGLLLASANDAANVIGEYVGGTIPDFMDGLNNYLNEIGCRNTYFNSPHGHHHPDHITTAYDMSLIAKKAMENPLFAKIVSTPYRKRPKTNKQEASHLVQTNNLLRRRSKYYYEKAIGIKTGHGSHAKYTLVAAAQDKERKYIAVLLGCNERKDTFLEAKTMLEAAFNQPLIKKTLMQQGKQKYMYRVGDKNIPTYTEEAFTITYPQEEKPSISATLVWEDIPTPIQKGTRLGEIRIAERDGGQITTIPLFASIDFSPSSHKKWLFFAPLVVFFPFFLQLSKKKKKIL